jgi:predicted metal-dependent hydrolase
LKPILRILRDIAGSPQDPLLPDEIFLPALEVKWSVSYRRTNSGTVQARCNGNGVISVTGRIGSARKVNSALRRWLSRQARKSLISWLDELSALSGLPYGKAAVRGQRSRWGSCSSRGNINLNYKLLFLPPDVVRYILHHELCHTVHPNHSRNFWLALSSLEPGYRYLNDKAKKGMDQVPEWARG